MVQTLPCASAAESCYGLTDQMIGRAVTGIIYPYDAGGLGQAQASSAFQKALKLRRNLNLVLLGSKYKALSGGPYTEETGTFGSLAMSCTVKSSA
jgi:hypothetical protein